ncbi:MAG: AIM24 family protein [Pseudomonadota bacterium]
MDGMDDFGETGRIEIGGNVLDIALGPDEVAWIRRSSLILADGPFALRTKFIAKKRLNLFGAFSGQVRWANRFEADGGQVRLVAGRDFHGAVASLTVSPDQPVHIMPGSYLGHQGRLTFDTKRVAKKEFWTLARVEGSGIVHIKIAGRPLQVPLNSTPMVADANYVAAITGAFKAQGKVFKAGQVLRSGELENVRLSGNGCALFQSENPEERASGRGGGPLGWLFDLLPF